jgi:hypothetical protein
MLVSRNRKAEQTRDITIANKSFENVTQFKYKRTKVTNQNFGQVGIKMRLNSGNA